MGLKEKFGQKNKKERVFHAPFLNVLLATATIATATAEHKQYDKCANVHATTIVVSASAAALQ